MGWLMNEAYLENVIEWSFPSLDINLNPLLIENISVENVQKNPKEEAEQVEKKAEEQKIKQEIENLKNEYQKKIVMLDSMIGNLENAIALFEDELIQIIHSMIKKIVKKIIYKELNLDPKVLSTMITMLCDLVHPRNNIINIAISEADFKRLELKENKLIDMLTVDPDFSEGDIVIKTDFTEIHAHLQHRINQIMENNHE